MIRIIQIGGSMGLQLNASKCELICAIDSIITDPTLSSFKIVQPIDSTLLGAPLFPAQLSIVRGRRDVLSYLALSAVLI